MARDKAYRTREEQYDGILRQYHGTTLMKCDVLSFAFPERQADIFFYDFLGRKFKYYILDQMDNKITIILPKSSPETKEIEQLAKQDKGEQFVANLKIKI